MKYKIDVRHLVPINNNGSENNAISFLLCNSETEAFDKFRKLSQKLLQINNWKVSAGKNPTEFYIYHNESDKSTIAQLNDLVKIKMPAPKNNLGKGFDWVKVNQIQTIEQKGVKAFLIQMKPHYCPDNSSGSIAHFYKGEASNTFILVKKDKTLQLSIHGRNEMPNTTKVGFMDVLRNLFVASGGIFGGSKIQWQDFTEEFLKNQTI
ncbi:hypothetical protein [Chryseobacterium sp. 3008163]|uniref:hypothetical protein n=1 Tax=Chryseobacterium sp. 3008163 TaxID=2478663 RepID=UPI000F0C2958|nr:hypothetical protein [Chryseobacterium sp. 3008163]AYM99766.1 hypothetical protein EAG08_04920 [Chryseobacterium sp. 3008163]